MVLTHRSIGSSIVNVLFVVCMVGGWNALQLTEVEYFHDVTLNEAVITTVWAGASADEVERLITAKIEEELQSVSNIDEIRSASQSNTSMISIDFDENLDTVEYEAAVNDVRGALDQDSIAPAESANELLTVALFGVTLRDTRQQGIE